MDFNQYYSDQTEGLNGFKGSRYQRGSGLGSMFKRFAKWAIPIIKQYATPVIKNVIKHGVSDVSQGLSNFSNDINQENKGIKESAKHRFEETANNIKNRIQRGGKRKQCSRSKNKKVCKLASNIFENEIPPISHAYKSNHTKTQKKKK